MLLYADDATVAWVVGGEETSETEQVAHAARLVSTLALRHLCRAGLSCHLKRWRASLLAKTSAHDVLKDGLYLTKRLLLADALAQNHGGIFFHHLAVFHCCLHKARLHHLAVVGDGVVEGKGADGRHLGLIADAHPGQRGLAPVDVLLSALVELREAHLCR